METKQTDKITKAGKVDGRRQFHKYLNKYLVETGTCYGDGVQAALDVGFERVLSYEIEKRLYEHCVARFRGDARVSLHNCSSTQMWTQISHIDEPITFWLDGHCSLGPTGFDPHCFHPLATELEIIKKHPIKTHTIMIDDRRLFGRAKSGQEHDAYILGVNEDDVIGKLKEINPKYTILFEDGVVPGDIVVAHIP